MKYTIQSRLKCTSCGALPVKAKGPGIVPRCGPDLPPRRRFAAETARIIAAVRDLIEASPVMTTSDRRGGEAPALLAALGCVGFGLLHILNVHPMGDGLWFWYARLHREGHLLYRDMHLNLPPFFVMVTALNQRLFGTGWLVSKVPAALQLVVYVTGLYLVSLYAKVWAWTRALLISAAFLLSIAVSFARFDDYHVPTYIAIVYSALLLLRYHDREQPRQEWLLSVGLALLGGVSLANRLNDGASLVAAQALLLPVFLRRRRRAATALFLVVVPVTLMLLVLLTGDTVGDWARESIFRAAAIKGGTGNLMLAPLLYPFRQIAFFVKDRYQTILSVFILAVTAALTYSIHLREKNGSWRTRHTLIGGSVLLLLFLSASPWLRLNMISLTAGNMGMVIATLLVGLVVSRAFRQFFRRGVGSVDPLPLVLLLPFLQGLGAAMTAAKAVPEITPAAGLLLLLLPIALPAAAIGLAQAILASVAFLLTAYGVPMKFANPYQWQDYYDRPMFTGRGWYRHPLYGPMYVEKDEAGLIGAMCSRVQATADSSGLLSIPNPYPNYFCGIPPWHEYVQTWYDTSSSATIGQLVGELQQQPPEWIVYQRNLTVLSGHEDVYRSTHLPHRAVDALIADRIGSGAWSIASQQCYDGADWLLIHTRPVAQGESAERLIPSQNKVNLCQRTSHTVRMP